MIQSYTDLCKQIESRRSDEQLTCLQEKVENVLDLLGGTLSDESMSALPIYASDPAQSLQELADSIAIASRLIGDNVRNVHEFFDALGRRGGPYNCPPLYPMPTRDALTQLICNHPAAISYARLDELLLPSAALLQEKSFATRSPSDIVTHHLPSTAQQNDASPRLSALALHTLDRWLTGPAAPMGARLQNVRHAVLTARNAQWQGACTALNFLQSIGVAARPAVVLSSRQEPSAMSEFPVIVGAPSTAGYESDCRVASEPDPDGVAVGAPAQDCGLATLLLPDARWHDLAISNLRKRARPCDKKSEVDITVNASSTAGATIVEDEGSKAAPRSADISTDNVAASTVLTACHALRATIQRSSSIAPRQVSALGAAFARILCQIAELEPSSASRSGGRDGVITARRAVLHGSCLLALGLWAASEEILLVTVQALTADGIRSRGAPLRLFLVTILLRLRSLRGTLASRNLLRILETATAVRPALIAAILGRAPRRPAGNATLQSAWRQWLTRRAGTDTLAVDVYDGASPGSDPPPYKSMALELCQRYARQQQGRTLPDELLPFLLSTLLSGSSGLAAGESAALLPTLEEQELHLLDALLTPLVTAAGPTATSVGAARGLGVSLALALSPTEQQELCHTVWPAVEGIQVGPPLTQAVMAWREDTNALTWDADVARVWRALLQAMPPVLSTQLLLALLTCVTDTLTSAVVGSASEAIQEASAALLTTVVGTYRGMLETVIVRAAVRRALEACGKERIAVKSALAALGNAS